MGRAVTGEAEEADRDGRIAAVGRWLVACLRTDLQRGRGLPVLALAVVIGAGLYAVLPAEPGLAGVMAAAAGAIGVAALLRRSPIPAGAAALLAALLTGVMAATVQTWLVAAPVLERARTLEGTGRILSIDSRASGSTRIEIAVRSLAGLSPERTPQRIRVTTRSRQPLPGPGAGIAFRARLMPPRGPMVPGSYDGARAAFFSGIGATGYLLGAVRPAALDPPGGLLRAQVWLVDLRATIGARIRAVIPGPAGAVAAALLVGERGPIPESVDAALRTAGLAHILSISGVHMTLVAGTVFGAVRLLCALVPAIALRRPVKAWAAVAGLLAATLYLALSGAAVATQRSWVMIALVFLAVLVGRSALTLRTIAIAALGVTLLDPASVIGPSFQMSFAAVLGLIAIFEVWRAQNGPPPPSAAGRIVRFGRHALVWVAGVAITSVVAGLATAPAAAYHFGRVAPFGLLGNLLAMPIVGMVVMPAGVAALFLMPLGLDAPALHAMGLGIEAVLAIAAWLHGQFGDADLGRKIPLAAALWLSGGIVWIALWSTGWRWLGIGAVMVGLGLAVLAPRPDILITDDGSAVAFRGADGRLRLWRGPDGSFAARVLLESDGDRRSPRDRSLAEGRACDPVGCVLQAGEGGARVSILADPVGFADDCARVAVLVTESAGAPVDCAAFVVDPARLAETGALALRLDPTAPRGVRILATGLPPGRRPWQPAR